MATYNESIKQILFEVQQFMNDTIKAEKLSDKSKKHKTKILDLINKIQEEYNALKPDISNASSNSHDESIFTGGSGNSEEEVPYTENIRVSPAASLNQPLKTGYLEKRRKGLMGKFSYQKRYCVIHSAVLYYYEKPTDKKQNGAFPLNGYEFREAPQLVTVGSKKELSFELVGPGKRTYEFLAENKEEFNSWREAVESCHNEPISEELYEDIEDLIRSKAPPSGPPPPPVVVDDGEEYEVPQTDPQETYDQVAADQPPVLPAPRKVSTHSVPKISPPSIPKQPLPELPVQPPKKRAPKLNVLVNNAAEDYENMYFGKWDCSADTDDELKFNKGDIIHIISKDFDSENWWVGAYKGSIGLVPKSYLAKAYELMP